jgi:hypothetical protein
LNTNVLVSKVGDMLILDYTGPMYARPMGRGIELGNALDEGGMTALDDILSDLTLALTGIGDGYTTARVHIEVVIPPARLPQVLTEAPHVMPAEEFERIRLALRRGEAG